VTIVPRVTTDPHPSNDSQHASASENAGAESAEAPLDPVQLAEERLALLREQHAALKDQLLRTAADFDNFRKRARREAEDAGANGRESMLRDLLPVFDNLERATSHADASTDVQSFSSGINMVLKQFQDTLKRLGIERLQSVGQAFDPNLHEAIQQLATSDFDPGTVAAEVQGGYRFGDKLIRPAMVVVAKAAEPSA
jgi:molecular chaperone GrpE